MFYIGGRTFALISVTLTFNENLMRIAEKFNIWAVRICRETVLNCQFSEKQLIIVLKYSKNN